MKHTYQKLNKSTNKTRVKKVGGTIRIGNGGIFQGTNATGWADVAVLNALQIRYNPVIAVPDLISFYRRPDARARGFNMSFREALNIQIDAGVNHHTIVQLLVYAYDTRLYDADVHYIQGYAPHGGHAYIAGLILCLSFRVSWYVRNAINAIHGSALLTHPDVVQGYTNAFIIEHTHLHPAAQTRHGWHAGPANARAVERGVINMHP